jgi:hypothetical protein
MSVINTLISLFTCCFSHSQPIHLCHTPCSMSTLRHTHAHTSNLLHIGWSSCWNYRQDSKIPAILPSIENIQSLILHNLLESVPRCTVIHTHPYHVGALLQTSGGSETKPQFAWHMAVHLILKCWTLRGMTAMSITYEMRCRIISVRTTKPIFEEL